TLVLATSYVLSREPGPVVANLSTTSALAAVVESFGCSLALTKIGEVNVTEAMQRDRAVIGGEGNGGVIYPRVNFARDSLVGIALILHYLAATGISLSQLLSGIPRFYMLKEKLACPSHSVARVLRALRHEYSNYPIDTLDGLKVMLAEGWFLVRASNTEPIMRVIAEAKTETDARNLLTKVFAQVEANLNSEGETQNTSV
ncbi:MAG TPA: hypothetical protein VGU64_11730, partial [Terriglobales bacterium]|nr:hypothetical protein [Terriglobales bacterium]